MNTYYLEFSSTAEHSHKFYEVTVNQTTVIVRFGRIGTDGTTQAKTYATVEEAQKEADKKCKEKLKKGYQLGDRVSSPNQVIPENVTPEVVAQVKVKNPEVVTNNSNYSLEPYPAPILWKFNSGFSSFGLAVENQYCWLGNEKGRVLKLDDQGQILEQYQLPRAVKCIVTDDIWVYVGCDNGVVYDMTGKFPYIAYEIESALDIFWLDIYNGILGVSDANGGLTKIDPEGEILWSRLSPGKQGWMLRCDAQGFYHGHSKGLTKYDTEQGRQLWHQVTVGKVLFGCQKGDKLYGATSGKRVQCFDKNGEFIQSFLCDASVYACAVDDHNERVFAADSSGFIYGFNAEGKRLWKASTGCGSALSMQFSDQRLYLATNQGILACMDVNQTALKAAEKGHIPTSLTVENTLVTAPTPTNDLARIKPSESGILLECFRQGERLRVRVISEGYHPDWMVQFPRNLRQEGDRYLVQKLHESSQGFYRIQGEIKRLV